MDSIEQSLASRCTQLPPISEHTCVILTDFRVESVWIAFETQLDCQRPFLFVFEVVVALYTITVLTEFAVCEAVAVQLEALAFRTVAWLFR